MKISTFVCLAALVVSPAVGRAQNIALAAAAITNAPTPEAAQQQLENAPGKVVSTPASASADIPLTGPAADVAKLIQSGVDESVVLNYIAENGPYNLSSDDIVYFNDLGVSSNVINAMLQRDETLPAQNPGLASQPAAETSPSPAAATAPLTPTVEAEASAPVNASYTYFYDSLAPYGNWIDVQGYGWCWQPTVVALNPGWQPYCNQGHWIYSDSGWYWVSDYSWGWAPFHYGRWFRNVRFGWCWAPDTVWGPSWVSWRYSAGYCGWAPLPPVACFTPGIGFTFYGRHMGYANFSFGIGASYYTFVPIGHCFDRHPWHYRVPHGDVTRIYNHATVINNVTINNNRIINHGIPISRIEHATHTQIRPVAIHETADPRIGRGERVESSGRGLTVYRPHLPAPARNARVAGEGVRPAPRQGNLVRGVTPPERVRREEVRTQRNQMRTSPATQAVAPRERVRTQQGREIPQAAPGIRRQPESQPRTLRQEGRGRTSPAVQPTPPQTRPQNVPRTAPLTPRGPERQQLQQQQRQQERLTPRQPQRQENIYRQEAPRYQAPRYQAPRYQAPRYEAPRYQAPQFQQREFRPTPQGQRAPSYRFESPGRAYSAPPQNVPAPRSGGNGGGNRGGRDRNRGQ